MTDIPLNLMCVRKEVLRALGSENAREEREHRELANELMREVVRELASDARQSHDWSVLSSG